MAKTVAQRLTKKQRAHLKEFGVRLTLTDIKANLSSMITANPNKSLSMVCRECSEIGHRLELL